MTFVEELDRLVEQALEDILWEYRLNLNEVLWGSAYGPWPPPRGLAGLQAIIIDAA